MSVNWEGAWCGMVKLSWDRKIHCFYLRSRDHSTFQFHHFLGKVSPGWLVDFPLSPSPFPFPLLYPETSIFMCLRVFLLFVYGLVCIVLYAYIFTIMSVECYRSHSVDLFYLALLLISSNAACVLHVYITTFIFPPMMDTQVISTSHLAQ